MEPLLAMRCAPRLASALLLLLAMTLGGRVVMAQPAPDLNSNNLMLQFAGNIGLLAVGVETPLSQSQWDIALLLGYAPASATGAEITTLSARTRYRFSGRFALPALSVAPYAGISVNHSPGNDNGTYAEDYYNSPSSDRTFFMPYLGLQFTPQGSPPARGSLYVEIGTVDSYLAHYFNNRDQMDLRQIVDLALGLRLPLR
jgi:hypothetical protein